MSIITDANNSGFGSWKYSKLKLYDTYLVNFISLNSPTANIIKCLNNINCYKYNTIYGLIPDKLLFIYIKVS